LAYFFAIYKMLSRRNKVPDGIVLDSGDLSSVSDKMGCIWVRKANGISSGIKTDAGKPLGVRRRLKQCGVLEEITVMVGEKIRKMAYRKIRFHWLIERIQYELRRNPTLKLEADFFKTRSDGVEIFIRPGQIIIDCGANVGGITSLFARTGATVYAFEPNPLCFEILSARFRAFPSVHCFNRAIMDRDCTMTLRTPGPHEGFDSLETTIGASVMPGALRPNNYIIEEVEVECVDIDRFIRSLRGRVRLLKLDVEGAEVPAMNRLLDTGTIELIDKVLVETHEGIPGLKSPTEALHARIEKMGLATRVNLDWH
jgi:FkbM family methyltransferase